MRIVATLVGLAAASSSAAAATPIVYERGELRMQDPAVVGEHVVSPLPHTYLGAEDVPARWRQLQDARELLQAQTQVPRRGRRTRKAAANGG